MSGTRARIIEHAATCSVEHDVRTQLHIAIRDEADEMDIWQVSAKPPLVYKW